MTASGGILQRQTSAGRGIAGEFEAGVVARNAGDAKILLRIIRAESNVAGRRYGHHQTESRELLLVVEFEIAAIYQLYQPAVIVGKDIAAESHRWRKAG